MPTALSLYIFFFMSFSRDQGLREVQEYLSKETDKEHYDPYQDQDERRRIRKAYRELTEKTLGKLRLILKDNITHCK